MRTKGVLSDAISMTLQERSNCQKAKFPLGGSHNTPLTRCRDLESPRIKSVLTSPPHCLHVRDLAGNIALCSRKRHFPLTVPLSASDLFPFIPFLLEYSSVQDQRWFRRSRQAFLHRGKMDFRLALSCYCIRPSLCWLRNRKCINFFKLKKLIKL